MAERPDNSINSAHSDLTNRVAVVSGSSSGLGRAMALEFASAGADVVVHARHNADAANDVANQIRALGRRSHIIMADLSDAANCEKLVSETWHLFGRADIWVNNAGADVLTGDAVDWSFEKKMETLWRLDVSATIALSRLVGQRMFEDDDRKVAGVILNMGWDQAEQGMAGDSGEMFAATKGAVMAFSKSLAQTLAPRVRVNCLAPGWIKTSWGEQTSESWQQRAKHDSLLGRWGTPQDVAATARFLVSPAADFITGQTIAINGGFRFGPS